MGQKKGQTGNPNGRPVGVPNKVTTAAKEAIVDFINANAGEINGLFQEIKAESPREALRAYADLLEFVIPKLARTESKVEGNLNHTFGWGKDE